MLLEGSCHCRAVNFTVETQTPYPYQHCYCETCRKTQGGGGSAVNIMGWADSLKVEGEENITVYHARIDGEISPVQRRFCNKCGSALWVYHDKWPELVHPFASAINSDLPKPDEVVHIMIDFKANWVDVPDGANHRKFDRYPDRSIEVWHEKQGLTS